jgi:hypothetical protein
MRTTCSPVITAREVSGDAASAVSASWAWAHVDKVSKRQIGAKRFIMVGPACESDVNGTR